MFRLTKSQSLDTAGSTGGHGPRTRRLRLTRIAALVALLAVLPAAGAASPSSTTSQNLVTNPSFESNLSGWGGYSASLQHVSGGADGSYSASVTAKTGSSWSIYPLTRQVSSTTLGTVYTATAAVKARSGSKNVCISIREWSGSKIVASAGQCVTPSSSWRMMPSLSYTARGTGNTLDFYAWGSRGTKGDAFDVDALSLTAGADSLLPLAVVLEPVSTTVISGTANLAASVTGTAARVDFLADGKVVASDSTAPFAAAWNTTGVADGSVSLSARAVAPTGETATSAAQSVRVDNTAPDTSITSGPSGTVTSSSASFGFSASESSTFQCDLDGAGWAACSSPKSYSSLPNGGHTFRVRAIDAAGNVDGTPASRSWTVSVSSSDPTPPPPGCSVDAATMTAPGCTVLRQDSATASDPRPGLWGSIECATSTRHQQVASGGDPARKADGTSRSDSAYRNLTVVDGDNFYGQRCELGRNEWRYGENTGSQTSGSFGLYQEGERKITFFSQRYGAAFNPNVNTWQAIFQQKQAQPYEGAGSTEGVAIEIQIHSGKVHLANFWSTKWSTTAPKLGTWIRYALDVTYSTDPSVGKLRLYVDANGDGDWSDAGEVSPIISGQTLAKVGTAGYGLKVGDAIPGHLRVGIYNNPTISCPSPGGCQVDVDNVQIVK